MNSDKPIYILGIHDGHNCGATLVRDGIIVASVSEERLTRVKNEVSYPRRAIEEVLRIGGISVSDLAEAAYASLFMHARQYLTDLEPWYCVGAEQQKKDSERTRAYDRTIFDTRKRERQDVLQQHLGIDGQRITFVEHHLAHLAAAYYTAPTVSRDKPMLGLTCDGAGDGISGSVSICLNNQIDRLATTNRHASLGKIYSRTTLLLGMKPWEHEYKLMGLAPYADPERAARAAEALRRLIKLSDDGLSFVQSGYLSTNYCYEYLRENFERVRFDTIAGAVQLFTEELLVDWVRACIRHTGINDIVCGGGVFMNVKANMRIAQMPEVSSMYVMPSAADESISLGAALHRYYERTGDIDHQRSILDHLYLGGDYGRRAEEDAVSSAQKSGDIVIRPTNDVNIDIARLLASGEIVARCCGRMEWGARALGNRSILASAHDSRVTDQLNKSIKQRDFWMPFAPSIRAEDAGRYLDDPKGISPKFMTFAFPTRTEASVDLAAAQHPRDLTVRPQIVSEDTNSGYHQVLTEFKKQTGRGGILNTSFNLHGEPIVNTPTEAIDVFRRSGLRHLALDHFVLSKAKTA